MVSDSLVWLRVSKPRIGALGFAIATSMSACGTPQRAFVETNDVDAGGDTRPSRDSSSEVSTAAESTSAVSTSEVEGSSSVVDSGMSSITSSDSSSSGGETEPSGPSCDALICPPNTDCRTYRRPDCEGDGGAAKCESADAEVNTPCQNGAGVCDGEGECLVLTGRALGASCQRGSECGSGICVLDQDGVASLPQEKGICCDAPCDAVCAACSYEGHCDETPARDPACKTLSCPESSACLTYPEASAGRCGGFGECLTVADHCEPTYVEAGENCGTGLVCDGKGACVVECPSETGSERHCTEECPCDVGEGLCTADTQCVDGLVCTEDAILKLGYSGASCLPEHCVNDKKDAEETSVDCGGGCGCRATYEEILISGVPDDAVFAAWSAMSGDGSAFAGTISRDGGPAFSPPYPVRIGADGVVTELPNLGVWGNASAISADGSVIVGDLWCDNPPACTSAEYFRTFRWVNGGQPTEAVVAGVTSVVSTSGNFIAGLLSAPESSGAAFRASPSRYIEIPQLNLVVAISADGEYVAGRSSAGNFGAVWSATANDVIALTPPSEWTTWGIDVMSDDGSVFVGSAYDGVSNLSYIWKEGTFFEFPKLPGAEYNLINGMSADGTVVAGLSGTNPLQRAFLWDENKGMRTVLAEIAARGLELPVDLELIQVDHLSDDGRILVGWLLGFGAPAFWRVTLAP